MIGFGLVLLFFLVLLVFLEKKNLHVAQQTLFIALERFDLQKHLVKWQLEIKTSSKSTTFSWKPVKTLVFRSSFIKKYRFHSRCWSRIPILLGVFEDRNAELTLFIALQRFNLQKYIKNTSQSAIVELQHVKNTSWNYTSALQYVKNTS